jgi:hypothetical protein
MRWSGEVTLAPSTYPLEVGGFDNTTWAALGLTLTLIGLCLSYVAYKRRGVAAGVRGVAWSLLPLAAGLTRTLKLAADIVDDVGSWAAHLVFSPFVWLGIALAGVSVVLFGVSGKMGSRNSGGKKSPEALPKKASRAKAAPVDDDMADIEAILRKHGIQ